ncbi:hypothetical protein HCH_01973 [Hahella chejuensis KCTC 2396]|uniref:Uncharacterized protein n=1 Tax=Hahella chejuensis (strain KCTC 2396) TaxID=349521 RepID=Q2SKL8_HAHCH|nr:hypothetical protein HCH_01973 [Hahella chejuensis KCTC 2396]
MGLVGVMALYGTNMSSGPMMPDINKMKKNRFD